MNQSVLFWGLFVSSCLFLSACAKQHTLKHEGVFTISHEGIPSLMGKVLTTTKGNAEVVFHDALNEDTGKAQRHQWWRAEKLKGSTLTKKKFAFHNLAATNNALHEQPLAAYEIENKNSYILFHHDNHECLTVQETAKGVNLGYARCNDDDPKQHFKFTLKHNSEIEKAEKACIRNGVSTC